MTLLSRVRFAWLGMPGGPGVSTFYCHDPATFLGPLRAFFLAIGSNVPDDVTFHLEPTGEVIESSNGALTGAWTQPATADFNGGSSGVYAAPVGVSVKWLTDLYISGRRLKGRTFFVPLAAGQFGTTGQLLPGFVSAFQADVNAFVAATAGDFAIWSRPAPGGSDGGTSTVDSGVVGLKAAVLRSRRD